MKQVTQTLATGVVEVVEVPVPALTDTFVLVRNTASVISAGTEKTKIDMGKKNLLQKARARPDLVRQVLKKVQAQGLKQTLQTVRTRLNAPSPLGYSCAGSVVAVGGQVPGLQPGDRVACGGADYANHAEFVAVPRNLVVKIPDGVTDEEAAFATVGAIALQGVRLAEPLLGETVLVVGLGLLGQIAVQLLRANGCNVLASDLDAELIERAAGYGAIGVAPGADVQSVCTIATAGRGVDAVLVCAGSSSNAIIEMCGKVLRQKGRVVVVGAVPMNIPREDFFKKEISVVISRSYGPGRYDPEYEERGHDYPIGYVRFTEQRNLESFLDLIAQRKIDVAGLVTHRFPVDQAPDAYRLIEGAKTVPYLGIVLNYSPPPAMNATVGRIAVNPTPMATDALRLSLYGAGNYATANLLPHIVKHDWVSLTGLVTASGRSAQSVAAQFGFAFCASDLGDVLSDDTDALLIATRHDTHASAVIDALRAGKHVFVEKPLGLTIEELLAVKAAMAERPDRSIMVGFNRRFAPATLVARQHFATTTGPKLVNIRVNAGSIPVDHWIQDPVRGGGRIIGEGCHFVDLAAALVGSRVTTVHAVGAARGDKSPVLTDDCVIALRFADGSAASILYTASGSPALPKEYIEIFGGGRSAVIDDFRAVTLYPAEGKAVTKRYAAQDKGQGAMLSAWLDGLRSGNLAVAPEALLNSSIATVLAVESLMTGAQLVVAEAAGETGQAG